MSEFTKISWCDSTHNFWRGCTKVSDGCKNCYAEAQMKRFGSGFGKGVARIRSKDFKAPLKWNKKPWVCEKCGQFSSMVASPRVGNMIHVDCGGIVHRRRVFSLSLGDWLDNEVPIQWLADMLDVIRQCPELDFLLLTKRPGNFKNRLEEVCVDQSGGNMMPIWKFCNDWLAGQAPKNIWIGISAENQEQLERRANKYVDIPAVVHFISAEPLLGPLDFEGDLNGVADWIIIGGESGPNWRKCSLADIVSTAEIAQDNCCQVFVKQDCGRHPGQQGRIPDHIWKLKQFPTLFR